jgi:hypothetical protein
VIRVKGKSPTYHTVPWSCETIYEETELWSHSFRESIRMLVILLRWMDGWMDNKNGMYDGLCGRSIRIIIVNSDAILPHHYYLGLVQRDCRLNINGIVPASIVGMRLTCHNYGHSSYLEHGASVVDSETIIRYSVTCLVSCNVFCNAVKYCR